jgi:lipoate-protein ligase A
MICFDYSDPLPARNLALDEALLNSSENGQLENSLRFWESPVPFVVLGVNQRVEKEVQKSACARKEIPILRRCSAGGCVVQGPGCLNYSLILSIDTDPKLSSIGGSYTYILGKISQTFLDLGVEPDGISDLTVDDRKISGSAQRRRRQYILHHGTMLYDFDLDLIPACLREPEERPDYRGDRTHESFVRNLPMSNSEIKALFLNAFPCSSPSNAIPLHIFDEADTLIEEKYNRKEWNFRK